MAFERGRNVHAKLSFFVAVASLALNSATANANCVLSPEPPHFTETLNPDKFPKLPENASCPAGIEKYRTDLEFYRKIKIEGYNRKLISFGNILKQADDNFRRVANGGSCSSAEYESYKSKVTIELEKIGNDYKAPYDDNIEAYKLYIGSYRQAAFRCMVSSTSTFIYAENFGK
jgi:hypothetical protein